MPFLADDGLMLALYQARQAQEKKGEEGEESVKKKNMILDNRSISNSNNSRVEVVAVILGIFLLELWLVLPYTLATRMRPAKTYNIHLFQKTW